MPNGLVELALLLAGALPGIQTPSIRPLGVAALAKKGGTLPDFEKSRSAASSEVSFLYWYESVTLNLSLVRSP